MTESNAGPLDGFRILDFTNFLAGPLCTRMLADMGAEVIKVELPAGDQARHMRPFVGEASAHHMHLYAGKKSVALDLKSTAGREAALELAKRCDVVVENWRPGVSKRLGLDYDALSSINSKIVYCSISGYGQTGPGKERPAYAPIVEALSGYTVAQQNFDQAERPQICGLMIGDSLSAVWAFAAIQTALLRRERTGMGSHVDVALLDAMLFASPSECEEANLGRFPRRFHAPMKTTDGYMIVAPTSEQNFQDLARAVGHPEWLADPRFNPIGARFNNWAELSQLIEAWTSQRSTGDCERLLGEAGIPCGRFRSFGEAMDDPQVVARGTFSTLKWGGADYRLPNVPFQIPGVPTHVRPLIAELGQHNAEVLGDILGYTAEQIQKCAPIKPMPRHR